MSRKILPLIFATGFALLFNACGSDGDSVSGIECEEGDCFEESSSSSEEDYSSSSVKTDDKSSGSQEESSSGGKNEESSSSAKESSSSEKEDASSSSAKEESSSSELSSSSGGESSSSTVPVTYLSTTPNLADLEVSGDTLFAIFQRQAADYTIPVNGLLAMYNAQSGELLDTITLATKNPSMVKVASGNVYVATAGEYDASYSLPADEKRGIEKVDLKSKTSTLFVSGKKLGGGAQDFVVTPNGKGYASVYKSYSNTIVVEIDLATGKVKKIDGIKDASGSLDYDAASDLLYIGDRFMDYNTAFDMNINVFTYDGNTLTPLTDPENEFRQPYSIKIVNGNPYVFVSDYNTGKLYLDYADEDADGISFFQDSKLAVANGKLYLMERGTTATISQIDLSTGTPVWQENAGDGANPYDIVAADDGNLWVAFYGIPEIRKISASGKKVSSIDTQAFCAHE